MGYSKFVRIIAPLAVVFIIQSGILSPCASATSCPNGLRSELEVLTKSLDEEQRVVGGGYTATASWPSSRKPNGLIFDEQADPAVLEAFQANPRLDGSVRVPTVGTISANLEGVKRPGELKFRAASIQKQRKPLRKLLKDLKNRSTIKGRGSIEFGAILIEYEDGSSQVIKFTSREGTKIEHDDTMKALAGIDPWNDPRMVKRITHIHTHPPGDAVIAPSGSDYYAMGFFEKEPPFRWGPDGPNVQGIVLPICQQCDDLLVHYNSDGYILDNGTSASGP